MGLDLVVEGCARPGHEAEWRRLVERAFADLSQPDPQLSDAEMARFNEISIPAYERIGAPRVGSDPAADAWIIAARESRTPEEIAATLKEFAGHYAVALVKCDGVPGYSNGGLYDGVDETSFRGAFLGMCKNVIATPMQDEAWGHKFPEEAVAYGRALLAAADAAERAPLKSRGKLRRLLFGIKEPDEAPPLAEQLDIVRAAGRWYVFWGERGHPIRAYF